MAERLLVVSDLHLGMGLDRSTACYDRRENFLADHEFAAWLEHYRGLAAQAGEAPGTLVLGGDTFDFIRIDKAPTSSRDYEAWAAALRGLGRHALASRIESLAPLAEVERKRRHDRLVSRRERKFGLQTDDYKTIWKLELIVRGHEALFGALGRWVAAGGALVIVKGNHDVELYWPLVQQRIRAVIADSGGLGSDIAEARISFKEEGYRSDNVYVEHGHRWETMTAVHTDTPVLPGDPSQISLPLGSFVNRYLINGIEQLDPYIDNVKPVGSALTALLRRYPLTMFSLYLRGWSFLKRALRVRGVFNSIGSALQIIGLLLVPTTALVLLVAFLLGMLPEAWRAVLPDWLGGILATLGRVPTWLFGASVLGVSLPALVPIVSPIFREILRFIGFRPKDHLYEGARRFARHVFPDHVVANGCAFVVMGHTHWQDVRSLDGNRVYMNSGTWVPIWPKDRIDLAGRVFYSFLEFTRDGPGRFWTGRALRWSEHTNRPVPARLISSPDTR